jgi:hypothetical protein
LNNDQNINPSPGASEIRVPVKYEAHPNYSNCTVETKDQGKQNVHVVNELVSNVDGVSVRIVIGSHQY